MALGGVTTGGQLAPVGGPAAAQTSARGPLRARRETQALSWVLAPSPLWLPAGVWEALERRAVGAGGMASRVRRPLLCSVAAEPALPQSS